MWIRVGGTWQAGEVYRWILGLDPPGWLAWTSYTHPGGYGHPAWGLFVYDPQVFRQRTDEYPPGDLAGPQCSNSQPGTQLSTS